MNIPPIDKIHLDEVALQEREALPVNAQNQAKAARTLDQVFNQDLLKDLSMKAANQAIEAETFTSFLWTKISSLWKNPEKDAASRISPADLRAAQENSIPERISHVPEIEAPDMIPADLQAAKFPSPSKKANLKNKLTPSEIFQGLTLMSERSIESIMFIIFKAQIELEKENANVKEGTFSKFIDFQKLQQKVLQEIKDVLAKDEKVVGFFQLGQNISTAASVLTGLAAAALTFGLLVPVGGFIGAAFGPFARDAFLIIVSTLGSQGFVVVSAGLTGLTVATKAYFKRLFNEHKAEHEDYEHLDRYYNDRLDDSRNRLMTTAEADMAFKEYWIRLLKRSDKMRKIVFKK